MKRLAVALIGLLLWAGIAAAQPFSAPQVRVFMGPSAGEVFMPVSGMVAGINAQTGTTYTVLGTDVGKLVTFSNAAAVAVTLPQAGTTGFEANKVLRFNNLGSTLVTITPTTSTISGAAAAVLGQGQSIEIASDGTNYGIIDSSFGGTICTVTGATPQTCNGSAGVVTTGTLTTAALTAATYTINNTSVSAASDVLCTNQGYSGTYFTAGTPAIMQCTPGAGTITVTFANLHTANALSGTLKFDFLVKN